MSELILALETSCDETAAAVLRAPGELLSSEISSQIEIHRPYGGVVPEVASRNHVIMVRPVAEASLAAAGTGLSQIDAFAATSGPGLSSSLLMGNTMGKALAVASGKPFLAINHLEGHLLSPFLGDAGGIRPSVALVVSGGHTMLVHLRGVNDYHLLGRTRDDAAGEAFDKVAKMLGLPYPGGALIDKLSAAGNPAAYHFPRSMLNRPGFEFSFSGLKTSMRYTLDKIGDLEPLIPDLSASFQEAIIEVLVEKTIRAARHTGEQLVAISGGVSCNTRLRQAFGQRCAQESLELLIAPPSLSTDNAAMIAYVAAQKLSRGLFSTLEEDIDPNLTLS